MRNWFIVGTQRFRSKDPGKQVSEPNQARCPTQLADTLFCICKWSSYKYPCRQDTPKTSLPWPHSSSRRIRAADKCHRIDLWQSRNTLPCNKQSGAVNQLEEWNSPSYRLSFACTGTHFSLSLSATVTWWQVVPLTWSYAWICVRNTTKTEYSSQSLRVAKGSCRFQALRYLPLCILLWNSARSLQAALIHHQNVVASFWIHQNFVAFPLSWTGDPHHM